MAERRKSGCIRFGESTPLGRFLLVLFLASAPLAAEDAKQEAKPEPKPPAKAPLSLTITGEIDAQMAPVAGRLTALFYQSYPKLIERFEHPRRPAARQVRLVFAKGLKAPAYASGSEIKVSVEWLTQHPDDIGLLTHELTHVVQAYPPSDQGWLVEGVADYARHLYGPEQQPGWALPKGPSGKQSYRDGYGVTARFLLWLETGHPGFVDKIHRHLQDQEFKLSDFETLAGKPLDSLWEDYTKELGKKP